MALTQIKTDAISDDAVTLAKQAAGTDGQIITYDASGNPTAVGPGTDGQVLTSPGAGSPPAFEDAAGGPSLANDANNRVITGTGSGVNGEANLTFDGDHLTQTIDADGEGFNQTASGNHYIKNEVHANRSSASASILSTVAKWNGKEVAGIKFTAGGDTTNKDDGRIIFETSTANDIAERVRIDTEGKVGIGTASIDNLLHVEQSGTGTTAKFQTGGRESSIQLQNDALTWKIVNYDYGNNGTDHLGFHDGTSDRLIIHDTGDGISFNGDTAAANCLGDYEEGTFTPGLDCNGGADPTVSDVSAWGNYIKIGGLVHIQLYFSRFDIDGAGGGSAQINGLPFTVANLSYNPFGQLTHTNDKFPSSQIPYGVYGRTNENVMQIIRQDGGQINWNVANEYYLGVSLQYYTTA